MPALLIVLLAFIAPVTLRLDARWVGEIEGAFAARVWGLGPDVRFRIARTARGHRLWVLDRQGHPKPRKKSGGSPPAFVTRLVQILFRDARDRRRFLRRITLLRLSVAVSLAADDAASTALVTGALRSLWRLAPSSWREKADFRIRPDFLRGRTAARVRCIVYFHLGTLLFTAAALLAADGFRRARPAEEV